MFLAVNDMRLSFEDFLKLRRDFLQIGSWEDFCERRGVTPATLNRVIKGGADNPKTRMGSRNKVAVGLGYSDWWDLVKAWKSGVHPAGAAQGPIEIRTDPLTMELARLAGDGDGIDIAAVLAPLSRHQMEQLANVFVRRLRAMDRQNPPAAEKPKRKGGQQ